MAYEKKTYTKKSYGNGKTTANREHLTVNRKRGKLAPLMTEEAKATASIHELSYDFGCRITRLFQYLTEDAEYRGTGGQVPVPSMKIRDLCGLFPQCGMRVA